MAKESVIYLKGIAASDGIRIGNAFVYQQPSTTSRNVDTISSVEVELEIAKIKKAKDSAFEELELLIQQTREKLGEDKADILSVQQAFLNDPSYFPKIEGNITDQHLSAVKAIEEVTNYFTITFEKMDNEYFKERAADIKDLGNRLIMNVLGTKGIKLTDIKEEVLLIAEDLSPSDTVQLDKNYVLGFATSLGGKTSHTAILARSLGVPAILGLGKEINHIQHGDLLIIDGSNGELIINPSSSLVEEYTHRLAVEREKANNLLEYVNQPAVTKDNVHFELVANIGTPIEAKAAIEYGAEGVGLYRTEFLFMQSKQLPTEEEQFNAYKEVAQKMKGKPIIIRTLDIGGDKELPYLQLDKELNPFLGYRAIRMCLDQKELFIPQLRAIIRASAYGKIKVMFPMISNLHEWNEAKSIFKEVEDQLSIEGVSYDKSIEVGIMVEIPSTALLASHFAKHVDFFSIGTNDLVQYTLAVDRMNEKVAYLYDHFDPAVIHLIKTVIEAAHKENKWVGMCGGMAGDTLATPLLIGLKLDEWSMDVHSLNKVKKKITELSYEDCKKIAEHILSLDSSDKVRAVLQQM